MANGDHQWFLEMHQLLKRRDHAVLMRDKWSVELTTIEAEIEQLTSRAPNKNMNSEATVSMEQE